MNDFVGEFTAVAGRSMHAARIPESSELPVLIQDAARDANDALSEVLDAGSQVKRDLAELEERKDLIPKSGLDRLREEARNEAKGRADEADSLFREAVEFLEGALADNSLGNLPPEESGRVKNARDHALLAIGDAQGGDMASRVMGLARSTNDPDVRAVLNSGWLDTLAIARGAQVDRLRKAVRAIATEQAAERGEEGFRELANLKHAQVNVSAAFRHAFNQ